MNCKCKSAPDYHRDDCIMYNTDGTQKSTFELEQKLNNQIRKEVNYVIPVYFKVTPSKTFFKVETICKAQGTKKECPEFLKLVFNKVSDNLFNTNGLDLRI